MKSLPIAILAFMAGLSGALATTVLQADFQTYNAGNLQITGTSKAGTSNVFTITNPLSGNPDDYPTSSTGISLPGVNPDVATGYFSNTRTGTLAGSLVATNTSGTQYSNAEYRDYVGGKGFGTSTISFVYQPNFTDQGTQRGYLFSNNLSGSYSQAIQFRIDSNAVILNFGIGSTAQISLTTGSLSWDPAKYYFISASWKPGEELTIYIREVGAATGSVYTSTGTLVDYASDITNGIVLGNSLSTGGNSPLNGNLAYFEWTTDYTDTLSSYNSLYQTIVIPEPAPATLLALAGITLLAFRRRRAVQY